MEENPYGEYVRWEDVKGNLYNELPAGADFFVIKAFLFANERHTGQIRRGNGVPYIMHPLAVSYIVAEFKTSKHLHELIAAALLHDLLEDTDTTIEEISEHFTPLVASLVLELTSDRDAILQMGKFCYLKDKLLTLTDYALYIKLADRLHNISDAPTDKMLSDTSLLLTHLIENRTLTVSQKRIIRSIIQILETKGFSCAGYTL
jgi:(p)ppGpp synthase/HD superfamily hydrolase